MGKNPTFSNPGHTCGCLVIDVGAPSGQVQAADAGVQREDKREHDAGHHRREARQTEKGWVTA